MKLDKMAGMIGQMQKNLAGLQAKADAVEATGVSGAGLVKVTLQGKGALKRIQIDPSLLKADEGEILEDLIAAAHASAKAKLDEEMAAETAKLTAGLPLPPGFKLPF
ncbi:MAG: YbaB/EbfC family nucleoid-associated protein [Micropepsaceae bacterium]